jgi:predicted ABC-type exoprotein transport system permease subunit
MNTLIDICKRSIYLNIFIVVIPIIAYMIHNGSSATVALVWYLLLSLIMPWAYLSFKSSTFDDGKSISRIAYVISWIIIHGISYKGIFLGVDLSMLWNWPTVGRDVAFLVAMYIGVTISLIFAYGLTRLVGGRNE